MKIKSLFKRKQKEDPELVDHDVLTDLNVERKDMIRGIVELSDTAVKEVMVPRIDVVFIDKSIEREQMITKMIESGHSRFPVYQETIDNVTGIIYVKDLFSVIMRKTELDISTVMREPYFVPETMKLDALLKELKSRRVHIAVVVDEYGGVSGIVCLEDILEEIVGDIQDEFDNEQDDIMEMEKGVYLCDARVNIEDLNAELNLNIPDDECETLGGYVFDLFGKIPGKFEKVTKGNLDFIIQTVDGHKIKTVKVVIHSEDD